MNDLENHVLAYYAAGHAKDLVINPRWYPYGELVLVLEDKMTVAVRKFGRKARSACKGAATAFLDGMIAKGAWDTKENEFGGRMHQFNADAFKKALGDLAASDPVARKAAAEGDGYWETAFEKLTSS